MSHARDIVFALVLAVVIVALGRLRCSASGQCRWWTETRRLPRRCFPGAGTPRRIVRLVSSARPAPSAVQPRLRARRGPVLGRGGPNAPGHAPDSGRPTTGLSPGRPENVLRYYEMYENGGCSGEGVRETNDLCLLIEPTDRVLLPRTARCARTFDPTFMLQTWWFAAVPSTRCSCRPFSPSCTPSRTRAGTAETGRDVFTTVVERLEHQGMRDHRIVCPDANGVLPGKRGRPDGIKSGATENVYIYLYLSLATM